MHENHTLTIALEEKLMEARFTAVASKVITKMLRRRRGRVGGIGLLPSEPRMTLFW